MSKKVKKRVIKFISYDGRYPNLCSGVLKFSVDNKEYDFDHILVSGGSVTFNEDWEENVSRGSWSLEENELIEIGLTDMEIKELTNLVNENVTCGCCGGCV